MAITGFHHMGLYVADMARSLAFYRNALGGREVRRFPIGEGSDIVLLDLGGGAVIELIPVSADAGAADVKSGWAHIALLSDDPRAAFDAAVAAGAEVWMAPAELELGGVKTLLAYVFGPDHEILEFYLEL
jgi:catechol 2,3-dioxygenase-like lactoylglutathione lyase family enzyme